MAAKHKNIYEDKLDYEPELLTLSDVISLLSVKWLEASCNNKIDNPVLYAINEVRQIVDDNDKEVRARA